MIRQKYPKPEAAFCGRILLPRKNLLRAFLPAVIFAAALELPADDTFHEVTRGETIYSIARSYQIKPDELMKFNNITDPAKLQAGKRLKIPAVSGSNTAAYTEYQVEKNDTLYSIARRYGVNLQALRETNRLSETYVLKAGDRLKIPRPAVVQAVSLPETYVPAEEQSRPDASLRWPVAPKEIAYLKGKLAGVSITGEKSEPVKSLIAGTVVSAGPYRGFGRVVIIQTDGGFLYVYGGCESLSVKEGDHVGAGTELGRLGMDAVSGKPELFFLVYNNNAPIDPAKAPRA